jgi:hypothetical protein
MSFWPLDISSVTDGSGDAFTRGLGTSIFHNVSGSATYTNFYYAKSIAGGTTSLTLNFSGGSTYLLVAVAEVSGLNSSAPLDQSGYHESLTATTAWSSAAVTTTAANEYLFSWAATEASNPTCASPATGWVIESQTNDANGATVCLLDRVVSATGSYQASGTASTARDYAMEIVTFKGFPVWVSPSMVRVGPTDAPGATTSISLSGGRGETVDTQVIVQAPGAGLTNVNLSASALTGPGGATIPASSVTLYREYYVTVAGTASYGGGSNPPLGSGTYAEPLIPFSDPETGSPLCGTAATLKACNATISAGQNQPYWIDISVPHGATNSPPGTYTGRISITADQGTVTVPVTLTVWNFELPVQPSELSLWTLSPPAVGTTTTLVQALMRNKVMGWYDDPANASSHMTNFGLNRSGLDNYYYIGLQCNGSYSSLPSTSQINAAAANFPAGLGLDLFPGDELNGCTGDYTPLKTLSANAHAANRSVKIIFTLNTPDSNLYGAVDHWVLLDSLQQWPALPFTGGGDLWSYTSCNTGFGNTPEWLVDYPPINERIQAGFLNWTQGATGILYYRSDGWTAGNTIGSWNNVDTTACGGGLGRPGDGIFLYPPGPIASTESAPGIRLKAIRDGMQDYEYAQILKNLGQVPFVNSIIVPIATSWSNWSHATNALEGARLQLGQKLNQLSPQ